MLGPNPATRRIVAAAALAGTLDLLFAMSLAGSRGAKLDAVPRYIASGLAGEAAAIAPWAPVVGIAAHFAIMIVAVALFFVIAREPPFKRAPWWSVGAAFGASMYAAMNLIVLPLSLAKIGNPSIAVRIADLASHLFFVGLVSAWMLRHMLDQAHRQSRFK
jgi:hypothetical protein